MMHSSPEKPTDVDKVDLNRSAEEIKIKEEDRDMQNSS
jgi:hypothetical protein